MQNVLRIRKTKKYYGFKEAHTKEDIPVKIIREQDSITVIKPHTWNKLDFKAAEKYFPKLKFNWVSEKQIRPNGRLL